MTTMIRVTIDSNTVKFQDKSIQGLTNAEIVDKAAVKIYGSGAYFSEDYCNKGYGQVCKPIKGNLNTSNCLTPTTSFFIER